MSATTAAASGGSLGPAAAILDTLAAVEPLFWTPFYNRARLYRGRPRPAPPEVVLDLTKDCPFDCSFCFASGTLDSGRRMEPELLADLEVALRGVPRLILVGGEPLTHPRLREVLSILAAGHDEIEIYSNALALPEDSGRRAVWLRERFADLPAHFTLTVAVDRFHAKEYGAERYRKKIDAVLALVDDPDAPVAIRFNVTAEGLSTAGYLVVERIEACLAELHEGLLALFQRANRAGQAEELFYFNPIVRLGRAADAPGEYLQAEDALFEPQVVLSPTPGGGLELLNSLPATWMPQPPPTLRLGAVSAAGLAGQIEAHIVAPRLGEWLLPGVTAAFDWLHRGRHGLAGQREAAATASARLGELVGGVSAELAAALGAGDADQVQALLRVAMARQLTDHWPLGRERWYDHVAERLRHLCSPDGPGWDLSPDRPHRRLVAPILRRFLAARLADDPAASAALVQRTVDLATAALARGAAPAFAGYRVRQGLITDPPEAPLWLSDVPLDLGGATPYFGDALVRPRLVLNLAVAADGTIELELDGLGEVALASSADLAPAVASFQHLLGILRWLLPESCQTRFSHSLTERLQALAAEAGVLPLVAELRSRCAVAAPIAVPDEAPASELAVARLLLGKAYGALTTIKR